MIDKKNQQKIMKLIEEYSNKHDGVIECGGEYIYQEDDAQIDAIQLVSDIFDLFAEEFNKKGESDNE